eukprot:gb/GECG01010595.1/.p1 GENE.gb/GECG01010595.1/~~gb/GECG01010595.1/.p1  ORF type:complete len:209 (+),score=19.39 gb/GECG01010595.1/:1-627(+)
MKWAMRKLWRISSARLISEKCCSVSQSTSWKHKSDIMCKRRTSTFFEHWFCWYLRVLNHSCISTAAVFSVCKELECPKVWFIMDSGNLFDNLPTSELTEEEFTPLRESRSARIYRIVSTGQSTPEGQWYDQEDDEWVVVLQGEAQLQIEGEDSPRHLSAGDYLLIPAHTRHRVASTSAARGTEGTVTPTVWLAVHHGPKAKEDNGDSH